MIHRHINIWKTLLDHPHIPLGGWQHCGFGGSKERGCLGFGLPKGVTQQTLPSRILPVPHSSQDLPNHLPFVPPSLSFITTPSTISGFPSTKAWKTSCLQGTSNCSFSNTPWGDAAQRQGSLPSAWDAGWQDGEKKNQPPTQITAQSVILPPL